MWSSCLCVSVMASSQPSVSEAITGDLGTGEHEQEMTAFSAHLGQLGAGWCHGDSPEEQLGSLMSGPVEELHWHRAGLRDKHNYSVLPHNWFLRATGGLLKR